LVGSLTGINSGATTFNVRVRPIFSDGIGGLRYGSYGASSILCIVPASGTSVQEELVTKETDKCGFVAYPNPSDGKGLAILSSEFTGRAVVRIMDGLGRIIHTENLVTTMNSPAEILFGSQLTCGLYFVEILCEGSRETIKLVVSE
jgi:hypothetical protein